MGADEHTVLAMLAMLAMLASPRDQEPSNLDAGHQMPGVAHLAGIIDQLAIPSNRVPAVANGAAQDRARGRVDVGIEPTVVHWRGTLTTVYVGRWGT